LLILFRGSPIVGNISYHAQISILNINPPADFGKNMNDPLYYSFGRMNIFTAYSGSIIRKIPLDRLRPDVSGFRSDMAAHGVINDTKYRRIRTQKFAQKITRSGRSFRIKDSLSPPQKKMMQILLNTRGIGYVSQNANTNKIKMTAAK
jgi:hypothetical protein